MDYDYIESLVYKCKNGDAISKEELANEFKPLIINISKRTFIDGYDNNDIKNECYHSLFKCVSLYNLERHKFVAYATNSIKNNVNDLIKHIKTRSSTNGNDALSFHADSQQELPSQDMSLEDFFCDECDLKDLKLALNNLTKEEKGLIDFIFFKNNTLQDYAYYKNMCYSTACLRKKVTLNKIYASISLNNKNIHA